MTCNKGFTLVELLVVITIIVILIALLTPNLERAFNTVQRTECLTNLKAIGTAIGLYLNDSKRSYPAVEGWGLLMGQRGEPGQGSNYENWHVDMRPLNQYLGYTVRGSSVPVTECPSDVGDPLIDSPLTNFQLIGTSYQEALHTYSGVEGAFGWAWDGGTNAWKVAPAKASDFNPPHNKILSGDYVYYGNRFLRLRDTRWHQVDYYPNAPFAEQIRRHNVLMADLHAEYFAFDNSKIDNEADPSNATRVPNSSIGWW